MTVYEVVDRKRYCGHQQGTIFEARLDAGAEARAIARGAIRIIDPKPVTIDLGRYTPPARNPKKEPQGA